MDTRTTLKINESFLKILNEAMAENRKVNMLTDDGGISRLSGYVRNIDTAGELPAVELATGEKIPLAKIIAVDGIFLPDYGEC